MTPEERVFARHTGGSLLLDSNLLLVLLAGLTDSRLFGRFKRISIYSVGDFELLMRIIARFSVLLTTPHVLTEVSNLANSLPEDSRRDWLKTMANVLVDDPIKPYVDEKWTAAAELADLEHFALFGLTDTAISQRASEALILTDDIKLSGYLRNSGTDILNFRDLRQMEKQLIAKFK